MGCFSRVYKKTQFVYSSVLFSFFAAITSIWSLSCGAEILSISYLVTPFSKYLCTDGYLNVGASRQNNNICSWYSYILEKMLTTLHYLWLETPPWRRREQRLADTCKRRREKKKKKVRAQSGLYAELRLITIVFLSLPRKKVSAEGVAASLRWCDL